MGPGARFRARHAGLPLPASAARESSPGCEDPAGVRRAREAEGPAAQFRFRRTCLLEPARVRAFQGGRRHRDGAGALQGRRSGHPGPYFGPGAGDAHPGRRHDPAEHQIRQAGGLGGQLVGPVALYPELPAIAETFPGFETESWVAMFAPAATPKEIVERLHASLSRILADPGMAKRFEILGAEIVAGTPQALARVVRDDQAKWGKVIRDKKITVE